MEDDEERARVEAAGWLILLQDEPDDGGRRAEFRAWLEVPGNRAAWESVSRTGALLASIGKERADEPVKVENAGVYGSSRRAWRRRPIILLSLIHI